MSTEKDEKISILLEHAKDQYEVSYKLFSSIDAKYAWLLAFLLTSLTFVSDFLLESHSDLLTFSVMAGLVALGVTVFGFLPKTFQLGSGSRQVTEKFWPDDQTVQLLNKDLLSNYNAANEKNIQVVDKKALIFKAAIAVAIVYVISFIIFFSFNYDLLSR